MKPTKKRFVSVKACNCISLALMVTAIAGCAAGPRGEGVPANLLATWKTESDCQRVKAKARGVGDAVFNAGDETARRLASAENDPEAIFLTSEYIANRPFTIFGHAAFKDEWYAACLARLPAATR